MNTIELAENEQMKNKMVILCFLLLRPFLCNMKFTLDNSRALAFYTRELSVQLPAVSTVFSYNIVEIRCRMRVASHKKP